MPENLKRYAVTGALGGGWALAVQWFKNGDHPDDDTRPLGSVFGDGKPIPSEGKVVRYYRSPDVPGKQKCSTCSHELNDHGWIDSGGAGQRVCPGDYVLSRPEGGYLRLAAVEAAALLDLSMVFKPLPKEDPEGTATRLVAIGDQVVWYRGERLKLEMDEVGSRHLPDLGFEDDNSAPSLGVHVWEGSFSTRNVERGADREPDVVVQLSGAWRGPTPPEWEMIRLGADPFTPSVEGSPAGKFVVSRDGEGTTREVEAALAEVKRIIGDVLALNIVGSSGNACVIKGEGQLEAARALVDSAGGYLQELPWDPPRG